MGYISDLTIGMIIVHLFTFDPSWFSFTKKFVEKYDLHKYIKEPNITHIEQVSNSTDEIKEVLNTEKFKYSLLNWSIFAIVITIIAVSINIKGGIYESINRLTYLTIDMY